MLWASGAMWCIEWGHSSQKIDLFLKTSIQTWSSKRTGHKTGYRLNARISRFPPDVFNALRFFPPPPSLFFNIQNQAPAQVQLNNWWSLILNEPTSWGVSAFEEPSQAGALFHRIEAWWRSSTPTLYMFWSTWSAQTSSFEKHLMSTA
jgi:hypothetical protein